MSKLAEVFARVFASKKVIYAAVPIVANAVASFMGYDPTAKALIVLDAAFALLLVIQGLLDIKFGSFSDDTEKVALKMAVAEKAPAVTVVNK